jgi:hypothetical protein
MSFQSLPIIIPIIIIAWSLLSFTACKSEKAKPSAGAPSASVAVAPSAAPSTKAALYAQGSMPIPTGPRLAILPGEGVGAIRFGATTATIERLMQDPCEVRTESSCRYISRAVEFFLKDGVVDEIRIHRLDRPADPKPRVFGVFNGRFVKGAMFGMYREAVAELLVKPKRTEPAQGGGGANTVEIHHYDDMRLEYDKIDNGNVVLGGVILTAPKK